jgi:hypothetical protein
MADKMGLSKVKIFNPKAMKKVAAEHLTFFTKRVKGGLDAKGDKFLAYTKKYAKLKKRGFVRKDGKNYASLRGRPVSSRETTNPDFTLTGLTLKNLKPKQYRTNGYVLRFTGQAGDIVKGNKSHNRDITSDVPEKEKKFIAKRLERQLRKEFRRLKNVRIPINIKIG